MNTSRDDTMDSCVALDVKTSGLHPEMGCRIVEIALVSAHSKWSTPIRFTGKRHSRARKLHHLSDETLEAAPTWGEVWGEVETRVRDAVVVGHNVLFDMRFVAHELRRAGLTPPTLRAWDTLRHAKACGVSARSLGALSRTLGLSFEPENLHGALYDASLTYECARVLSAPPHPTPLHERWDLRTLH